MEPAIKVEGLTKQYGDLFARESWSRKSGRMLTARKRVSQVSAC